MPPASPCTVIGEHETPDAMDTLADWFSSASSAQPTFAPGLDIQCVLLIVTGDTKVEGNETFDVNLTGASGAGIGHGVRLAAITNVGVAWLSIFDATLDEGNSGATRVAFNVPMANPWVSPGTLNYRTPA